MHRSHVLVAALAAMLLVPAGAMARELPAAVGPGQRDRQVAREGSHPDRLQEGL